MLKELGKADAVELEPTKSNDAVLAKTSFVNWCDDQVSFLRDVAERVRSNQVRRKKQIAPLMKKIRKRNPRAMS